MKRHRFAGLLAVICCMTTPLSASVIPGRWEKVDALTPGFEVVVTLKSGDRLEGSFQSSGPDFLELVSPTGSDLRTAKRDVLKIVAKEKHQDGHRDGLLAGLLLGLGGGIAAGAIIYYTASGEAPESPAGVMAGSGMFGAGIGALTGYLADRSHKGTEVLYQAPGPGAWFGKSSISR
jgi:hypothetical protein